MSGTPPIAPDKGEAADQAEAAFAQLCALLRDAPTLTPTAIGHWTARDVAAHLAGGLPIYTGLVRGDASPAATIEGIESVNESVVAGVPEQDGAALMVEEASVHGYDIARALGRPWHIRDEWSHTAFRGLVPIMPAYVSERAAGLRARVEVRLRGDAGARVVFDFADGKLAVLPGPPAGRVDCHISAAPVPFLLVTFRRIGPVRPALTGQMLAWGRRPWLSAALTGWFRPA